MITIITYKATEVSVFYCGTHALKICIPYIFYISHTVVLLQTAKAAPI
jgi:hypothetical protein